MSKISRNFATILILIVCVVVVLATKFVIQHFREKRQTGSVSKIKGSDQAPIKVVEFIDFQCPACAHGAAYLKETIEKYPGAVRLELKHYPLQMHQHGLLSSRYAECAARQGKFWPFQDMLLARQNNWQRLLEAGPAFEKIAEEVDLDKDRLKTCLEGSAVDEAIKRNKDEGKALGVRSTPTYFVNGKMVVGKNSLEEELTKLLRENGY